MSDVLMGRVGPEIYSTHCHAYMSRLNWEDFVSELVHLSQQHPEYFTQEQLEAFSRLATDLQALPGGEALMEKKRLEDAREEETAEEEEEGEEAEETTVLDDVEHTEAVAPLVDRALEVLGFSTDLETSTDFRTVWIEDYYSPLEGYDRCLESVFAAVAPYLSGMIVFFLQSAGRHSASKLFIRWDFERGALHISNPLPPARAQALAALENPSVHTHEGWLLVGTLHDELTYGEWFPSWEILVAAFNEQTGHRYADAEDPLEAYDNDEAPAFEKIYNVMPLTLKLPADDWRQHEASVIEAVQQELRENEEWYRDEEGEARNIDFSAIFTWTSTQFAEFPIPHTVLHRWVAEAIRRHGP